MARLPSSQPRVTTAWYIRQSLAQKGLSGSKCASGIASLTNDWSSRHKVRLVQRAVLMNLLNTRWHFQDSSSKHTQGATYFIYVPAQEPVPCVPQMRFCGFLPHTEDRNSPNLLHDSTQAMFRSLLLPVDQLRSFFIGITANEG